MKRFGFFNSINGDRKYLASDISEALDIATTTGIKQEEGVFEVTPYEDMTIKINPGSALIYGGFFTNPEDELIELDMADGELNRIDRIAIRYDRFDRSVDTVVLKGTNALNPTPPTPLRNENQFDLVLADIYIKKATTEISTSDITDMRESELCGYIGVKGAVSQIEFDRHLSGNSGKHIKESGNNSNGSYIMYDDGTMTCTGDAILARTFNTLLRRNISFPATFVDDNYHPLLSLNQTLPDGLRGSILFAHNKTITGMSLSVETDYKAGGGFESGYERSVSWSAIGRWK